MRVAVLGVVQQCKKKQKQKLTVRVHVWRACQVAPRPWMAGCVPSGAQGEPVAGQWRRAGQRRRCRNPQNENRNGKKKPQAREGASPWTSQGSSELWGARQNVGTPRRRTQCPRDGCSSEAWGTNRTTRGKALRTVHSPRERLVLVARSQAGSDPGLGARAERSGGGGDGTGKGPQDMSAEQTRRTDDGRGRITLKWDSSPGREVVRSEWPETRFYPSFYVFYLPPRTFRGL